MAFHLLQAIIYPKTRYSLRSQCIQLEWNKVILTRIRTQFKAFRATNIGVLNLLSWLVIGLGTVLRLEYFLANRSLWLDEASLVLNIVNKPVFALLQRLDYDQAAPFGFLVIEKLAIRLFGNNELALRLFPMLCGILSLIVLYAISRRFLSPVARVTAVALLSLAVFPIYYSTEVKPYSSDVLVSLLVLWLALEVIYRQYTRLSVTFLCIFGVIAVWFSFPVIFVLAGIVLGLFLDMIRHRIWNRLGLLLLIGGSWGLSFGVYYLISLRYTQNSEFLVTFWNGYFLPLTPFSLEWVISAVERLLQNPGGLPITLGLVLIGIGCLSLLRRNKLVAIILLAPIVANFAASALKKYPIGDRLFLYAIPLVFLLIAEAIGWLGRLLPNRVAPWLQMVVQVIVIGILLVPVCFTLHELPTTREELRPVIEYVAENKQPDDLIYVYYAARQAFQYYAPHYGLTNNDVYGIQSRNDLTGYAKDLDQLRGHQRVWIVISHPFGDEEAYFVHYMAQFGTQCASFAQQAPTSPVASFGTHAATYLFDATGSCKT